MTDHDRHSLHAYVASESNALTDSKSCLLLAMADSSTEQIVQETMRSINSWEPLLASGTDAWTLRVECKSPFPDDIAFPIADGASASSATAAQGRVVIRSVCADDVDALIAFLLRGLSARRSLRDAIAEFRPRRDIRIENATAARNRGHGPKAGNLRETCRAQPRPFRAIPVRRPS